MKSFLSTIIVVIILSQHSYSQLNLGFELTHTANQFFESNSTTFVSEKKIAYLNYKFKIYMIEVYYSDDLIRTLSHNFVYPNDFYEYGLLLGVIRRIDSKNFNASFGLYNRNFSYQPSLANNFGKKLGLTGKIQFGFEFVKGLSTGLTLRTFQDVYNLREDQNQLLLGQSSFCFTMEVDLSEFYNKFLRRNKKKKLKRKLKMK
jgi:hypothetical protein